MNPTDDGREVGFGLAMSERSQELWVFAWRIDLLFCSYDGGNKKGGVKHPVVHKSQDQNTTLWRDVAECEEVREEAGLV